VSGQVRCPDLALNTSRRLSQRFLLHCTETLLNVATLVSGECQRVGKVEDVAGSGIPVDFGCIRIIQAVAVEITLDPFGLRFA